MKITAMPRYFLQPRHETLKAMRSVAMRPIIIGFLKAAPLAVLLAALSNSIVVFLLGRVFQQNSIPQNHLEFLLGSTILALLLYPLARNWKYLCALHFSILLLLCSTNAIKIALLEQPVMVEDLLVIGETFSILSTRDKLILVGVCIAFAVLLLYSIRIKTPLRWGLATLCCVVVCTNLVVPGYGRDGLAAILSFRDKTATRSTTYQQVGPLFYLWHNHLRYRELNHIIPDRRAASAIKKRYSSDSNSTASLDSNAKGHDFNVYIILGESVFYLDEFDQLQPNPFAAINSLVGNKLSTMAAVPTFGGGTARSELELLCGIPHVMPQVEFVKMTRASKKLQCLPREAMANGYEFYAFHANNPGFWNRAVAYQILGIPLQHYFNNANFFSMEKAGDARFIPDDDFFEQSLGMIKNKLSGENKDKNIFYLLTSALHRPYALNADDYPQQNYEDFAASSDFQRYLSGLHYTTEAIHDFVKNVQQIDPKAMIVFMGDHWPPIGADLKAVKVTPKGRYQTPYFILRHGKPVSPKQSLSAFDIVDYIYTQKGWSTPYKYIRRYASAQLEGYRPIGELLLNDSEEINCALSAAASSECRHLKALQNVVFDALY